MAVITVFHSKFTIIGYKMLIFSPKISHYFSITSKNTHTLPASSERASTHNVDKGKIWCVENCRKGKGKHHYLLIHYTCPIFFPNGFFFPFFKN